MNAGGVSLNAQGLSAQSGTDIASVYNILKDSVVKPVFRGSGNTPASVQSDSSSPNVYDIEGGWQIGGSNPINRGG